MRLRALCEADIPFAMSLKQAAGWNQTEADWRSLISFRPHGCFLAEDEGRPAGTVTTIDHGGEVGWIGMLLVAPELRGRGIGTGLLQAAMQSLSACTTVKLDATPAGRKIYLPMGFAGEAELERRVRQPASLEASLPGATGDPHVDVRPVDPQEMPEIADFDAEIFGRPRRKVLEAWREHAPRLAFTARRAGELQGYCLGRPGTRADQIGPIVAESMFVAERLLLNALEAAGDRSVFLDVFARDAARLDLVDKLGFTVERRLTRMFRGLNRFPGRMEAQWAIAGFEVG